MSVVAARFQGMEEHSDRLDVQVSVGDQMVLMRVAGEVDIATVAAFRSALWSAPPRPVLQLDLSELRLLSAAGVRTLLAAHLRVRARGGELVLVDPSPVVARVLRVNRAAPRDADSGAGPGGRGGASPGSRDRAPATGRLTRGGGATGAAGVSRRPRTIGQRTPSRSTTKISVSPGLMTPAAPRSPYPRCGGMVRRRRPPTRMPTTPWSQPAMT